jgi:phospholipid-binding lipoprotein MlaA
MDYDPWESINDKTFYFNFNLADHYAIKPAAKVWSHLPEQFRQSLANAFYNLDMPKRFVNKVLQGRLPAAGLELARFVVNTTVGVAGLFDVASRLHIEKTDADTGETFALYGVGPGPYLVVPLLPPLDVRDAFGFAADSFMDPLSWFVTPIGADFGRSAAKQINERANNMQLYDDVEDSSLDLYAAVRNGYLQRRRKFIEDAIRDRDRSWERISHPSEPEYQPPLEENPKSTEPPSENDDVESSTK